MALGPGKYDDEVTRAVEIDQWPIGTRFWPTADGRVPRLRDKKGGDPLEWPEDLRVREMP